MKTDKITVEFSRKNLTHRCDKITSCRFCNHTVKDFVKCNLIFALPFKIKEQK